MADEQNQAARRHTPRVQPPPPLDVKKGVDSWKIFKQMWNNYCVISRITAEEDAEYVKALFLHTLGPDGLSIYNGMQLAPNHKAADIITALDDHFIGKTNETYERYVFNKRDQKEDETFEEYSTALRTLQKTCNHCEHMNESLLRDRIVLGIKDNETRKRLLQESQLTLKSCIEMCRASEATHLQMRSMKSASSSSAPGDTQPAEGACAVTSGSKKGHSKPTCKFCAQKHVMKKEVCPAWGQTCSKCQKEESLCCQVS
jgi:hypothetical protein